MADNCKPSGVQKRRSLADLDLLRNPLSEIEKAELSSACYEAGLSEEAITRVRRMMFQLDLHTQLLAQRTALVAEFTRLANQHLSAGMSDLAIVTQSCADQIEALDAPARRA
jgi:hypothetical protein